MSDAGARSCRPPSCGTCSSENQVASTFSPALRVRELVLGVPVDVLRWSDAVERMFEWAAQRESRTVCACNVHSLVTARRNAAHADAVWSVDLAVPDGAPVAWLLRRKGHRGQERIGGPDLMWICCREAAKRGIGIFLCGTTPEVLGELEHRLSLEFPGIRIVGTFSPPFRQASAAEDTALVTLINRSGAGIVWVGLGCPKQEEWLQTHRGRVRAVMVGVGAAFDFHAGRLKRAPVWVRRAGFEWLHRLCQEPRRLAARYIVTNTAFVVAAAQDFFLGRFSKIKPARPVRGDRRGRNCARSCDRIASRERGATPLLVTTSWDDGYPADLRVAELLQQHGLQGTFFVPSQNAEGREVMRRGEIAQLATAFEIGGHTHSHISLTDVPRRVAAEQINSNKRWLEDLLGEPVRGFAYVRGHYDAEIRDLVIEAGYEYARTTKNLMSIPGRNQFELCTTAQFYPHTPTTYIKNYVSGVPTLGRAAVLAPLLRGAALSDRLLAAARACATSGGHFHLWGHSWEIEQHDLWAELDRLFGQLRELNAAFVSNDGWGKSLRAGAAEPFPAAAPAPFPMHRTFSPAAPFSRQTARGRMP